MNAGHDLIRLMASLRRIDTGTSREKIVAELTDGQLFDAARALQGSEIFIDDVWLPLIVDEMKRRGLRPND